MYLCLPSDLAFSGRSTGCGVSDQALQLRRQIHAVVEPICEGAEVVVGGLAEHERVVAPANHGLEVAQDGVDPGELGHVAGLALADDDKTNAHSLRR